jgi:hypothetical protein
MIPGVARGTISANAKAPAFPSEAFWEDPPLSMILTLKSARWSAKPMLIPIIPEPIIVTVGLEFIGKPDFHN